MSSIINSHAIPFSEVVYSVLMESGKRKNELQPGQLALFDTQTWLSISPGDDYRKHKEVVILVGSPNISEPVYGGGVPNAPFANMLNHQLPYETMYFTKESIVDFYKDDPVETSGRVKYYGYNGLTECGSIKVECGKTYEFELKIEGPRVQTITGQYCYTVRKSADAPCCPEDDCTVNCGWTVECAPIMKEIIRKMYEDHVVRRLLKLSLITSCPEPTIEKFPHFDYCITLCDTGDVKALSKVQAQYPGKKITRESRVDSMTTYKIWCTPDTVIPDYVQKVGNVAPECNGCQSGYTETECVNVFTVIRPIAGTEDITTPAAQQTLADTIGGLYGATKSTYLSTNTSGIAVQIEVPCTVVDIPAQLTDLVTFSRTVDVHCVSDTEMTYSWEQCGCSYRTKRKLCIQLPHDPCLDNCTSITPVTDAPFTAELQEYMNMFVDSVGIVPDSVVPVAFNNCLSIYSVEQYGNDCFYVEGCDTGNDLESSYDTIPAFKGMIWQECKDCPTNCAFPAPVEGECCQCGIKIESLLDDYCDEDCYSDSNEYHEESHPDFWFQQTNPWFDSISACGPHDVPELVETVKPSPGILQGWKVWREVLKHRNYMLEPQMAANIPYSGRYKKILGIVDNVEKCSQYYGLTLLVDYSYRRTSSLPSSYGSALQRITLYLTDPTVREDAITLLQSYVSAACCDGNTVRTRICPV